MRWRKSQIIWQTWGDIGCRCEWQQQKWKDEEEIHVDLDWYWYNFHWKIRFALCYFSRKVISAYVNSLDQTVWKGRGYLSDINSLHLFSITDPIFSLQAKGNDDQYILLTTLALPMYLKMNRETVELSMTLLSCKKIGLGRDEFNFLKVWLGHMA